MSLPKNASWEYMRDIKPNSDEENTLNLLKKGVDWLNI